MRFEKGGIIPPLYLIICCLLGGLTLLVVELIELLAGQRNLRHGEILALGEDKHCVCEGAQIYAVTFPLAEVVLDVDGVALCGGQGKRVVDAVEVALQLKAVHIVHQSGLAKLHKVAGVGKCPHIRTKLHTIGAGLHLTANILPLPLIPIGNVAEVGLALDGLQLAVLVHPPAVAALLAPQLGFVAGHTVLLAAVGALVEHFVKTLGTCALGHPYLVISLPSKVVVVELSVDDLHNLVVVHLLNLLHGEDLLHRSLGLNQAVTGVPEGGVDVVALGDEGHHRHLQQLDQLAQRRGKDGIGATERVASLGIESHDFLALLHLSQLAYQAGVVGELTLGDAAHTGHKPVEQAADAHKTVNRHDVVGVVGEGGLDGYHKIIEGVVVTQQQVGPLDALHIDPLYACAVEPGDGEGGYPHYGPQPPRNFAGLLAHIEPFDTLYKGCFVVELFQLLRCAFHCEVQFLVTFRSHKMQI